MRPPLVSVVMIFLNAERFIREAIESVLGQTYDRWELVLVDDGSNDRSTGTARNYATRFPEKVRYVEHDGHRNRGMSASRNLGIRMAKGAFVTFLDADDVWLPGKLQDQVALLESHPEAAFVGGPAQWWYSWTGKVEDAGRDFVQHLGVPLDAPVRPPALLTLFLRDEWASLCDIVVRRKVIDELGGYEESFRGMYEDQVFHAKLCGRYSSYISSKCWYRYRQHPDACTAVSHRTGQSRRERGEFLAWLRGYVARSGMNDEQLSSVLQRQSYPYRHPLLFRASSSVRQGVFAFRKLSSRLVRKTPLYPAYSGAKARWIGDGYTLPVGGVTFGSLRRIRPVSDRFGFDRGLPIDRYYIEAFLKAHAADIRGHVLEVSDDMYTRRFGGKRVVKSDVLHAGEGNPKATIVASLSSARQIPSNTFDCIILTQTLQFIYDVSGAINTIHRILRPGGVVLATFPGISQIIRKDRDAWGEFWRFTTQSSQKLFGESFAPGHIAVEAYGNVLAATGFLHGLAADELHREELDHVDPDYEFLITVRAVKSASRA